MITPTQSEKRIAIAEALGWTEIVRSSNPVSAPIGFRPEGEPNPNGMTTVPSFFWDLNACNEAENALSDEQHAKFRWHLQTLSSGGGIEASSRAYVSAPASLRAEALYLVLCNQKTP